MPGATLRRSMAHLGLSQREPLRYSFMPSRRQSLQTGSVVRAIVRWSLVGGRWSELDAALLRRAAAVVRQRRHVLDGLDGQPGLLERRDRRLAPGARPLDADLDLLQAELAALLGGDLGGALGGERSRLAAALEADGPGGGVAEHVA